MESKELAQHSTGDMRGEHFLTLESGLSVAQVMDKLRDHQSVVAVFAQEKSWRYLSGEQLPELLLQGPEALQQPASDMARPLAVVAVGDSLDKVYGLLQQHAWVGVAGQGQLQHMLNWTSWARFAAQRRLTSPYVFSPEWGRNDASVAKV
jgi:hypothetical protein